jgi:hypothetical protein
MKSASIRGHTRAANRKRLAPKAAGRLESRTEVANRDARLANKGEK